MTATAHGPSEGEEGSERSHTRRRRGAFHYGRWAEALCALCLQLKGYRVVARDVRTPVGEIDLIARRGGLLVFIEVKARRAGGGETVLSLRQRQRIIRAAEAFLSVRPELASLDARFDLMWLGGGRSGFWPRHLRGAFRTDD